MFLSEAGWQVTLGSPFKVKDRPPFLMIDKHADVQPMLMFYVQVRVHVVICCVGTTDAGHKDWFVLLRMV